MEHQEKTVNLTIDGFFCEIRRWRVKYCPAMQTHGAALRDNVKSLRGEIFASQM